MTRCEALSRPSVWQALQVSVTVRIKIFNTFYL